MAPTRSTCVAGLALVLAGCATSDRAATPSALSQVAVASGADGKPVVTLPDCPNWRRSSVEDFSNRTASNFGCADAVNLASQVANPFDLVRGRGTGAQDGNAAAAAVERYRRGEPMPLAASTASGANIGPAAVPGSPSAGGGPSR